MRSHTVNDGPFLTPIPFSWQNKVDVESIQHEARLRDSENRLIPAPTGRAECHRLQAENRRIKRIALAGAGDRILARPVTEHVLDLRGHGCHSPMRSGLDTERTSSPAVAAGETLNSEEP